MNFLLLFLAPSLALCSMVEPSFKARYTTSGVVSNNASVAVLDIACFGWLNNTVSGSIAATVFSLPNAWQPFFLAVFPSSLWVALRANASFPTSSLLAAASYSLPTMSASMNSSAVTFAPILVTDKNNSHRWTTVLLSLNGSLPMSSFLITYIQTSGTAAQAASCPAASSSSSSSSSASVHEGHPSVGDSKTQVALLSSFGAIIWLVVVFYTIKFTCSQQYFTFANFVATLPSAMTPPGVAVGAGSGSLLKSSDVYGEGDSQGKSSGVADANEEKEPHPQATSAIRLDPMRAQREEIKLSVTDAQALTSCKAMPPAFATVIGIFVVAVVTGIYLSVLLSALAVPFWQSIIGGCIGLIMLLSLVTWLVFRFKYGTDGIDRSDQAVEELKHQFQYALTVAKDEIAEERHLEMDQPH